MQKRFESTISAINEVQRNNFRFGLQPIPRNLFGSELTTIEKRFKSEDSTILKLLLASILVQKFPEKISYDKSELFHMDLSLLILIRDFLVLGPENLVVICGTAENKIGGNDLVSTWDYANFQFRPLDSIE